MCDWRICPTRTSSSSFPSTCGSDRRANISHSTITSPNLQPPGCGGRPPGVGAGTDDGPAGGSSLYVIVPRNIFSPKSRGDLAAPVPPHPVLSGRFQKIPHPVAVHQSCGPRVRECGGAWHPAAALHEELQRASPAGCGVDRPRTHKSGSVSAAR